MILQVPLQNVLWVELFTALQRVFFPGRSIKKITIIVSLQLQMDLNLSQRKETTDRLSHFALAMEAKSIILFPFENIWAL